MKSSIVIECSGGRIPDKIYTRTFKGVTQTLRLDFMESIYDYWRKGDIRYRDATDNVYIRDTGKRFLNQ